jgi:hypothetical protein
MGSQKPFTNARGRPARANLRAREIKVFGQCSTKIEDFAFARYLATRNWGLCSRNSNNEVWGGQRESERDNRTDGM